MLQTLLDSVVEADCRDFETLVVLGHIRVFDYEESNIEL